MTPTPYQRELAQDIRDWKLFESGLTAYERLSGVPFDSALDHLHMGATKAQERQMLSRVQRMDEFRKLTPEVQQRALGETP